MKNFIFVYLYIYEQYFSRRMKMKKLQLTSVKLVPEEYKKFKMKCLDTNISLQQLVNATLLLYNGNGGFDQLIHATISGSAV